MKTKIHPTYHAAAPMTCNCGQKYTIGSTMEKVQVEVCSNCHPFYTGKQNLIDTAGRVDKFEERRKKAAAMSEKRPSSKKAAEKSAEASNTEKLKAIKSQVAAAEPTTNPEA